MEAGLSTRHDPDLDETGIGYSPREELIHGQSGGLASLQQLVSYPEVARRVGLEGRVFLQFIVDENGNVVDPIVVRGLGGGLDEEALRAVSQAKFKPGKQRGQAVNVRMSIPITFRLR